VIQRKLNAVRNVGLLLFLRVLGLLGAAITAALLPRIMGPSLFGQYALLTSLTHWFTFLGGLGIAQVVSRRVPDLIYNGDEPGLLRLIGNLLGLRILTGAVAAAIYAGVMILWLRDIDRVVIAILAVALCVRSPLGVSFAVFLGQGRIGRWALSDVIRQWGAVLLIVPGLILAGILGASLGYLACEIIVAFLALFGLKGYWHVRKVHLHWKEISPYLHLGLLLYAAELILSACERSGEAILRITTGDYTLIGHYGVSNTIYIHAILTLQQIATAFVPLLVALRSQSAWADLARWIDCLLKWLSLAAALVFLGSVFLAEDLVLLLFGSAYVKVAPNLVVLSGALILNTVGFVGGGLALVNDQPWVLVIAGLLRLTTFWCLGFVLAKPLGSLGLCLAVLAGVLMQALFFFGYLRRGIHYSFSRFGAQLALLLPFLPLTFLRTTTFRNFLLFVLSISGYLILARLFGFISLQEWRAIGIALRLRRNPEVAH
jgi:O-antigen/teichoic acid export membrane protein